MDQFDPFQVEEPEPSFMMEKMVWPKITTGPTLSDLQIQFDGEGSSSDLHLPLDDLIDIGDSVFEPFRRWLLLDEDDNKEETEGENEFSRILVKNFTLFK